MVEGICLKKIKEVVMLKLEDREWKNFCLSDLFDVFGTVTTHPSKLIPNGLTPRITCAATNNGLDNTYKNRATENGDVITIDSATIGYVSYQLVDFIATDHVEKLVLKNNQKLGYYCGLFIKTIIDNAVSGKYGYGYKFSQFRIKRQLVKLPITSDGLPDWQFMEDYMKQKEQQILKPTLDKLCKQLINNELAGGGKSLCDNWKEFYFTDVFTEIQRGKRLKKADHEEGNVPYVSSTSFNNGVDGFIGNESGVRRFENCITLANSGSVGSAFYHSYEFIASDHVTQLKRDGLDKYAYLFMLPIINRLSEKYSFNREINDDRIKREKLLLPVTENGEIDFQFMSSFMKRIEEDLLNTTIETFKNRLNVNKCEIGGEGKMEGIFFE